MLQAIEHFLNRIGGHLQEFVDGAPISAEEKTRLFNYSIFLALGLPTMLVYGLVNLLKANYLLCLLIFMSGGGLFAGLLALVRLKDGRIVYRINIALFGLLVIYMLLVGGDGGSKILWMYTFPLIAFFLFGKGEGLFWSGLMLLATLAAFWGPLQGLGSFAYSAQFKARFITTYLIVSAITYWFEYSRYYYRSGLEQKNRVLEEEKAHLHHEIKARRRLEHELRRLAATDALTGAANRRHFMELADSEFYRFRRYHHHLGLAMLDIDHFKIINDTQGHPVGDEVLKALVQHCRIVLRQSDLLGRIGGEEFAVLLVETNPDDAQRVAERLRRELAEVRLPVEGRSLGFTVSIGVTSATPKDPSMAATLKRADQALYHAKAEGRNRVVCR